MENFDDKLLAEYMDGFWGYGAENAEYWFVGMEEGGGDSFDEINRRIYHWEKRGRNALEDIYGYHVDINITKWFQNKAPLQPTWNWLIRVLLSFKGVIHEKENVRTYQIEQLGRSNGEVCLLELLPLPSPTTSHWLYNEHSNIPVLKSREIYTQKIGVKRVGKITQLIIKHQPKFVMFYGIGYLDWWRRIVNIKLTPKTLQNKSAYFGRLDNTVIVISQHPVATGVSLDYFHEIGKTLIEI
ncbi:MAG: hypothetical protein HFP81_09020 [Methylococcales symbiont of Hymedesmia sp. n. MRB-2018]|nr:MAG: hypothetical protein HFP81_09020 [Methylococcales symbiont of Hymedesmia sp. n. MRB-2018]